MPTTPGVYQYFNNEGKIIYVGKAKNLKRRVSSYFIKTHDSVKTKILVSNIRDIKYICVNTEADALLLENNLIKKYQPRYNILLKDDKGYHYIRISDDEFPRITEEKNMQKKGRFLGPYMNGFVTKETVSEVNRVFMLPTCNKHFPQDFGKGRPCLNYHIKMCMGLCRGKISRESYSETIAQAVEYIKNGSSLSVERMENEMNKAAENLEFEKAAVLRDRINAVKKAAEKQKIMNSGVEYADIIGTAEYSGGICVSVVMYRENRLFDKAFFELEKCGEDEDILGQFMENFYYEREDIPKVIVVDHIPKGSELLEQLIEKQSNRKAVLHVPQKGRLLELLKLAKNNSAEYAALRNDRTGREVIALEELAKCLGLAKPPSYIEAYDISNLSSESMVAGMVVFEDGRPLKKAYKRFTVKEQELQNDYGSMHEVLKRRLLHIVENKGDEFFVRKPDLILLDGGKGHVNAVSPLLAELGLDIPIFGMVKDNKHRTRAIATGGREIQINGLKSAFNLVTRIQDEVHRYSVAFMHSKHKKKTYTSEIQSVKGIGEKKAAKIMMKYKTRANLLQASPDELALVAGVNQKVADELWRVLHNDNF